MDARSFYERALAGYEQVVGVDHQNCRDLRINLAALAPEEDKISAAAKRGLAPAHTQLETIVDPSVHRKLPESRRRRILNRLGWER